MSGTYRGIYNLGRSLQKAKILTWLPRNSRDIYRSLRVIVLRATFQKGLLFNFCRNGVIAIFISSIIMHFSKTKNTAPGAKIWGKCLCNINLSLFTVFLHTMCNARFLDIGCHNYMIKRVKFSVRATERWPFSGQFAIFSNRPQVLDRRLPHGTRDRRL